MKHARFVQYYNGNLHQALGSDSCLIFTDKPGALTPRGMHNLAVKYATGLNGALGKGYVGYIIYTGRSFTHSFPDHPRKVYPTAIEFVTLCAEAPTDDPRLWS